MPFYCSAQQFLSLRLRELINRHIELMYSSEFQKSLKIHLPMLKEISNVIHLR